jgi:hypothetical protein
MRGKGDGHVYCCARAVMAPEWRGRLCGLHVQTLCRSLNETGGAQFGKGGRGSYGRTPIGNHLEGRCPPSDMRRIHSTIAE